MPRVLAALAECTDLELEGDVVKVGAARPGICVKVEDCPEGFRITAVQDPDIREVFENGALLQGTLLCPVGELDLSPRDIEELRKGRVFEFGDVADLVGRVLPTLKERLPVSVMSKLLPNASPMQPRLLLKTDFDGHLLNELPLVVFGAPPFARVDAG